jgi:hypothetical protein
MRTGERCHCCSAYLTFVSLAARAGAGGGGSGTRLLPTVIGRAAQQTHLPQVKPCSASEREIWAAAEERRAARLAKRAAAAAAGASEAACRYGAHGAGAGCCCGRRLYCGVGCWLLAAQAGATRLAVVPSRWLLAPPRHQCCAPDSMSPPHSLQRITSALHAPQAGAHHSPAGLPHAAPAHQAAPLRAAGTGTGPGAAAAAARGVPRAHHCLHDSAHHATARQQHRHHLRRPGGGGRGRALQSARGI